ncbi:MAG: AAA family ATPase, partial [Bacteroidales bacterium]
MEFQRIIMPQVQKRLESIPVVALVGSRQVGKTTLAKQLLSQSGRATIYLDLESPEDLNKLSMPERYLDDRSDMLVIIDEVQRMQELFPVLRAVIDKKRSNGRFLLLGSASPELLTGSSESLAGRISYFEVNPLLYGEVKPLYTFEQLWLRGGYPEMLMAKDDETSFRNRLDMIATYIERELPVLGLSVSGNVLRNLLKMV